MGMAGDAAATDDGGDGVVALFSAALLPAFVA
jgi:hypothetical protein